MPDLHDPRFAATTCDDAAHIAEQIAEADAYLAAFAESVTTPPYVFDENGLVVTG